MANTESSRPVSEPHCTIVSKAGGRKLSETTSGPSHVIPYHSGPPSAQGGEVKLQPSLFVQLRPPADS
jgi:hypothetical protein